MSAGFNAPRALRRTGSLLRFALIVLLVVLYLMPLYWMISTSFKFQPEIFRLPPTLIPQDFTLENYAAIIAGTMASAIPFLAYFKNACWVRSTASASVLARVKANRKTSS